MKKIIPNLIFIALIFAIVVWAAPSYDQTDTSMGGSNRTNTSVFLNVSWDNTTNLDFWIVSENQTGTWYNHTENNTWLYRSDTYWKAVMNFSITAAKGTFFHVIGYANNTADSWNNTNFSHNTGYGFSILFNVTVLNTPPHQPTIWYPLNNSFHRELEYINYSGTDIDGDPINFTIFINSSINITTISEHNITDWNASEGYYNLSVGTSDGTNTSINSTNVYFTIDNSTPSYNTTDYIADGQNKTDTMFYFNVTWMDSYSNVSYWIVSENQSGVWVNHTADNTWVHKDNSWFKAVMSFTINATDGTRFSVIGYANDSVGYWNNTWLETDYGLLVNVTVLQSQQPSTTTSEGSVGGGGSGWAAEQAKLEEEGKTMVDDGTIICDRNIPLIDRLISTCKIPNNGICDDGEWFLIDKDCGIGMDDLVDGSIFETMWLLRLLMAIAIFMLFKKHPGFPLMAVLLIALIILNSNLGGAIVVKEDVDVVCTGMNFFKNMGACIWKSNPTIGWVIVAVVAGIILIKFFKKRKVYKQARNT